MKLKRRIHTLHTLEVELIFDTDTLDILRLLNYNEDEIFWMMFYMEKIDYRYVKNIKDNNGEY